MGERPSADGQMAIERLVVAAHVAIVGLRADIELARQRLAAVEADAASTGEVISRVQAMVRDAHAEAERERDAAARRASVTHRAAELAAAHILAAATPDPADADGAAA